MHVSKLVRRSSALLVVLAAASACSDAPSAPRPAQRAPYDVAALQPLADRSTAPGQAKKAEQTASDNEQVKQITIDPNVARSYVFGENWIYFPAHSICDPATSGYGIELWETPCAPLATPVTITVHWSSKGGHAYARFDPELRFVPASESDVANWVILSLHDQRRLRDASGYSILYYGGDAGWVDEELRDPTLHAWINYFTNSVSRRIKHFSGYMLASGFAGGMGGIGDASY